MILARTNIYTRYPAKTFRVSDTYNFLRLLNATIIISRRTVCYKTHRRADIRGRLVHKWDVVCGTPRRLLLIVTIIITIIDPGQVYPHNEPALQSCGNSETASFFRMRNYVYVITPHCCHFCTCMCDLVFFLVEI